MNPGEADPGGADTDDEASGVADPCGPVVSEADAGAAGRNGPVGGDADQGDAASVDAAGEGWACVDGCDEAIQADDATRGGATCAMAPAPGSVAASPTDPSKFCSGVGVATSRTCGTALCDGRSGAGEVPEPTSATESSAVGAMAVGDSGLCDGGVRDGTPLVAATIAGVRDIGGIIGAAGGAAAGDAFTICGAGAAITAPALDPRDAAAVGSRRSEPCLAVRRDAAAPDGDAPAAGLAGGGSVAIETGDAAVVASDVAATEAGCGSTTAGATAAAAAKPGPAAVGAAAASACRKPPDVALIAGV